MGPAERVLAVSVARQYYLEGLSKIDIGKKLGMSRYKVARLLNACIESGLVQIHINDSGRVDTALSEALRARFGLRHVLVAETSDASVEDMRLTLGGLTVELLEEIIAPEDVLGVAWGRTIDVVAQKIRALPDCAVVQMTGVAGAVEANSVDLVRRFAAVARGESYPIYAPLVVSDAAALKVFHRQQGIRDAMDHWPKITVAIIAIGGATSAESQLYDVLDEADRAEIDAAKMACEICAIPFDAAGQPLQTGFSRRTMGVSFDSLRNIPHVIAAAGGPGKQNAILAALRSGAVTSLVTDQSVARFLMGVG